MATDSDMRIVIAVTEPATITPLWDAAMRALAESPGHVVTLVLEDERWRRAATLPFTHEYSRIGGAPIRFTHRRATAIGRALAAESRRRIEQLARDANLPVRFEFLSAEDAGALSRIVGGSGDILIAPALIKGYPIYANVVNLGCRILLLD